MMVPDDIMYQLVLRDPHNATYKCILNMTERAGVFFSGLTVGYFTFERGTFSQALSSIFSRALRCHIND